MRAQVNGEYQPIALTMFNPGSRQHCRKWLQGFGWTPTVYTPSGNPKVDDEVLRAIRDIPEAEVLADYFQLSKYYGMLYNGKSSIWSMLDWSAGVIKHHCMPLGANTGRMTHSSHNISQIASTKEFRSLFIAPEGYKVVGADMDAQELRILAHYLYPYDDGKYAEAVLNGKKEDKTDIHSLNQQAAGLETRDQAKTLIYAILYGASVVKVGYMLTQHKNDTEAMSLIDGHVEEFEAMRVRILRRAVTIKDQPYYPVAKDTMIPVTAGLVYRAIYGQRIFDLFINKTAGFAEMKADIISKLKSNGYAEGLDGRRLHSRSPHSIINLLCQSAAAIITKTWLVRTHSLIKEKGLSFGKHYRPLAVIHDEQQIAVKEDLTSEVGECMVKGAEQCDAYLPLNVPMSANYKVGDNWWDTH